MPKSDLLSGPDYAPVAERIALFYERYPDGRIITHLTMNNEREIMFHHGRMGSRNRRSMQAWRVRLEARIARRSETTRTSSVFYICFPQSSASGRECVSLRQRCCARGTRRVRYASLHFHKSNDLQAGPSRRDKGL